MCRAIKRGKDIMLRKKDHFVIGGIKEAFQIHDQFSWTSEDRLFSSNAD